MLRNLFGEEQLPKRPKRCATKYELQVKDGQLLKFVAFG